jgi:hypothetical protein
MIFYINCHKWVELNVMVLHPWLYMMIPCAACFDWEMSWDVNRCSSQMRWHGICVKITVECVFRHVLTVLGSIRPCPMGESRTRLFTGRVSCHPNRLYINRKSWRSCLWRSWQGLVNSLPDAFKTVGRCLCSAFRLPDIMHGECASRSLVFHDRIFFCRRDNEEEDRKYMIILKWINMFSK